MPILHLTYRQNQRGFSWSRGLIADSDEPTRDQIRAAAAALPPDSTPVYLAGGEPTLRTDLFEIIQELSDKLPTRDVVVVTDGRLFRDVRYCDSLAVVRTQKVAFEVVLVSTRAGVHDDVVDAENSFDRARQGIKNLLSRGRHTRIRVAVCRRNLAHLHEMSSRITELFAGIDRVIWDTGMFARTALEVLPDEASGYIESAINLLRARGVKSTISRMPSCAMSEKYRGDIDPTILGTFPAECAPCPARLLCPGVTESLAANPAFRVRPIAPVSAAESDAAYERYLLALLEAYVPTQARSADSVLDAMCGKKMRNLPGLRAFFRSAATVKGTDVAIKPDIAPEGTSGFQSDILLPLDASHRFDFIALFKPPGNSAVMPLERAVENLAGALRPGGHLLIVLAEHTDVEFMVGALQRLDLPIVTSEANRQRTSAEPEHKWVIVCRKKD